MRDFQDWEPKWRKGTESFSAETMTARNFLMLPVGMGWASRKDIALVGDAAHLINPFSDDGVNIALTDVMELAQAIVMLEKQNGNVGM